MFNRYFLCGNPKAWFSLPHISYLTEAWTKTSFQKPNSKLYFMTNILYIFILIWFGPLARHVKLWVAHAPGMPGMFSRHRLQRKPLVSDPGMHHGACATHVPWCMSGSLTRGGGESVPSIPGACATRNFTYLIRGPWAAPSHYLNLWGSRSMIPNGIYGSWRMNFFGCSILLPFLPTVDDFNYWYGESTWHMHIKNSALE